MLIDPSLFPCILKACMKLQSWKLCISVHATVIKKGFESYTSIVNSTMDFYIKCDARNSALTVFESMRNKDSVSWIVMVHGYLNQCASEEGLDLIISARIAGFKPNVSTLVLLLQACRILGGTYDGLIIHGFVIRIGFLSVVSVQNSLLSMYVKSCNIEFALVLFDEMGERDCISWSVLISGYAQIGEAEVAFRLFQEMCLGSNVNLDGLTMVSILQACTSAGDINLGRLIHGVVICSLNLICSSRILLLLICTRSVSMFILLIKSSTRCPRGILFRGILSCLDWSIMSTISGAAQEPNNHNSITSVTKQNLTYAFCKL
ncbi:pentatricopeptide repeat-containing protein At2g17210-like [Tasmannia lanceolata]|uniref:pentatricopeptide repeat-containing protein At2g17210-like n=1 Tax=Tasmannia lanceolata TaxID=3420 RepID=UPI004062ACA6